MVALAAYAFERWRSARAVPIRSAQSAAAFRWLVGRASGVSSDSGPSNGRAKVIADHAVGIEPEGEMWRITYQEATIRLRHSRGLLLLSHLIRHPGEEIHVSTLDAITPSGGSVVARNAPAPEDGIVPAPGDAGEVLDARARAEYRRRIDELRDELDDAEARGDAGRVDALRAEREALEDELRAAVGAGGRVRRAAGDAERLRVAITHRIRAAIGQIAQRHPALGEHLAASISTGYRCAYHPAAPTAAEGPRQRERKA